MTAQLQTRHHTREWLDWYATEHLPPEAGARLMRRTVTVTEWEPTTSGVHGEEIFE